MSELIPFGSLPKWVPGKILLASDELGWKNVALRAYHYEGQDVVVPPMRDFMLVNYKSGVTPMQRRFEGRWRKETLSPGACSLLTRAQQAYWNWREPIDVTHLYLSGRLVSAVATEMTDCEVDHVDLHDVLRVEDPLINMMMGNIIREARSQGMGGPLYVDSLSQALAVHLLRHYAQIRVKRTSCKDSLSVAQQALVREYIEAHLSEPMDLNSLGAQLGMGACRFSRAFRASFGRPPYAYVIERRLAKARRLLAHSKLPIKAISCSCGFSDQPHLTRLFRRAYGVPPATYRKSAR
ncbi:AraC family transcriptional regulator [Granulosicoccaceae sp. 1_MG-2023]|nr:AraC family transcriptional regulator [Granulosicoccaceae sp. 1_MG-2023]